MIIKEASNRAQDIAILTNLLNHPSADTNIRKKILKDIKNIQAGSKAERDAAYHINFHIKDSENWAVLHDLRLEHGGRVAQIDHVLINRLMEIWVCESKYWANGIAINEYGEFTSFYGNKQIGIPSPLQQNLNHIILLKQMFKDQAIGLPQRFNLMSIQPIISSAILVSTNARIQRPKTKIEGLDNVVKVDQFMGRIMNSADTSTLLLAKAIGKKTFETFVGQLASAHRPIHCNWPGKYGLSVQPPKPQIPSVQPVQFARPIKQAAKQVNVSLSRPTAPTPDADLLLALKAKRMEIARAIQKPAFVVFSDATLMDMIARRPATQDQFLAVSGVGPMKCEKFGPEFLAVLAKAS